jgi:hypothetical protein
MANASNNLDAGDGDFHRGDTIPLDAGSNSVSGGDAVKFDGSGDITKTTANSDDFIGIVRPTTDSGGSKHPVHIAGKVVAVDLASDGSCSPGDVLIPSATDNGLFNGAASSLVQAVDEGGSASYNVYTNHPIALDSGGNNDTVRAIMR